MKKLLTYLKGQFTLLNKASYMILALGIALETFLVVTGGASLFSAIAGLLGIICVLQTSASKKLNWLTGLISSIMIGWIAFTTHNFGIVFQQVLYVFMLDLPIAFSKQWNNEQAPATKLKNKLEVFKWIGFYIIIAVANFCITTFLLGGVNNLLNAALFGLSMTAVIGTVLKKKFTYPLWFIGGFLSIAIFGITAITSKSFDFALLVSYSIYLLNDFIALTSKKSKWK
jgi:nicotinamide mononucleotide transporter